MRYILTVVVALISLSLGAQELPERGLIRSGNRAYNKNDYKKAVERYDKAHQLAPDSFEALYNYANALYKDEQYAKAEELYASVNTEELSSDSDRADLFYNLANSQFMQQKYQEALESYKSSIRINHQDQEAKYNYAYTKKLLEDQENEGGGGGDDNQDQDQDQDQDQQEGDQNQDEGDQEQDQNGDQNQDQNQDEKEQEGQEQPSEGKISPQEQQQMLDAIQAQEDKTQEKLEEEGKGVVVRGRKNW